MSTRTSAGVPPVSDQDRRQAIEADLLALKVCDVACGSGHILLAAARRIGVELAIVRTGDEQPSPAALREAIRDVIRHCIHGMDLNPLAVELCKVALWLEAHVPGQPLSFLDHRIKCGNAIVGLAHRAELQRGIPDEAFKTLAGDDKELAASLRKRNKDERKGHQSLPFAGRVEQDIHALDQAYRDFENTEQHDAADYYHRREEYEKFRNDQRLRNLRLLADAQVAQFYLPKTPEYDGRHVTHDLYRKWLGGLHPTGQEIAAAQIVARRKSFAHWFLEFWDIVDAGGFDLILGNPPYLGGTKLSGSYGHEFCEWVKWEYAPAGLSDLVVYFLKRIYDLLGPGGFVAIITTNSIKDGDIREDGLDCLLENEGSLVFVNSGVKWPGVASLYVSTFSLHKGPWDKAREIDGRPVSYISAYFDDSPKAKPPEQLSDNNDRLFAGYDILGDGFLLDPSEARQLFDEDLKNREVLFPCINGKEVNSDPLQRPGRFAINFLERPIDEAQQYSGPFQVVLDRVKPFRDKQKRKSNRDFWWIYNETRVSLRRNLRGASRCFAAAATTKHLTFSALCPELIFTHALKLLTTTAWHDFALLQSTIHEIWARKYSGSLETRLRYSPTDCFATFPFPASIRPGRKHADDPTLQALDAIGEQYHEYRRSLMQDLWLGLTDLYNLFHAPDLDDRFAKLWKKREKNDKWRANVPDDLDILQTHPDPESAARGIEELRRLHIRLDEAVLAAYGWHQDSDDGPAIALDHGFYEQDFLPENDRIRHTLHPTARRELLTRLLKLNHQRAAEEAKTTKPKGKTPKKPQRSKSADELI